MVVPRIRMQKSMPTHLNRLIKLYDECSNTSVPPSESPESDVLSRTELQSPDVETIFWGTWISPLKIQRTTLYTHLKIILLQKTRHWKHTAVPGIQVYEKQMI